MISLYHLLRDIKHLKYKKIIPDISLSNIETCAKRQSSYNKPDLKISVIIPNYNYAKFLFERVYSILNQNYPIYELIILDDCSTDNSLEIINQIVSSINKYINVKVVLSEKNSGNAFSQWQKGFKLASGDYVWICEADDYCKKNFLRKVTKPINQNSNIIISYADTGFIDSTGTIVKKSLIDQIDLLKTGHWQKNYINTGQDEIDNYTYLNCTIPNVSGIIIKKDDYEDILNISKTFKQCGDWYFYLNALQRGKIAFNKKTLNYYRLHGNNISSTMNRKKHLLEIKKIYSHLKNNNNMSEEQQKNMQERLTFLEQVWGIK